MGDLTGDGGFDVDDAIDRDHAFDGHLRVLAGSAREATLACYKRRIAWSLVTEGGGAADIQTETYSWSAQGSTVSSELEGTKKDGIV
jgi:hypothetical protein